MLAIDEGGNLVLGMTGKIVQNEESETGERGVPNVGRNVWVGCSRALTLEQRGLARGSPATLESGER